MSIDGRIEVKIIICQTDELEKAIVGQKKESLFGLLCKRSLNTHGKLICISCINKHSKNSEEVKQVLTLQQKFEVMKSQLEQSVSSSTSVKQDNILKSLPSNLFQPKIIKTFPLNNSVKSTMQKSTNQLKSLTTSFKQSF